MVFFSGKICQCLLDEHQVLEHPICNWLYHEKGPSRYFALTSESIMEELFEAGTKSMEEFPHSAKGLQMWFDHRMAMVLGTNCGFGHMAGGNLAWLEDPRSLACEFFFGLSQPFDAGFKLTDMPTRHEMCICLDSPCVSWRGWSSSTCLE
jgi:hypothetical protein